MFTTTILVRFGDLDAAGIAYYPNLVNFLHEAFEEYLAALASLGESPARSWSTSAT